MSGGYDNKIVRGPADLIESFFQGNNVIGGSIPAATLNVFNVFNANSFYLNAYDFKIRALSASATGNAVITLYAGPNAGSLVGAFQLDSIVTNIASTPSAPANGTAQWQASYNVNSLNYRNRTGAPLYLHVGLSAVLTQGAVDYVFVGGPTSLLS